MVSDALTKGSVDRVRVHAVMDGQLIMEFPAKTWKSKVAVAGQGSALLCTVVQDSRRPVPGVTQASVALP